MKIKNLRTWKNQNDMQKNPKQVETVNTANGKWIERLAVKTVHSLVLALGHVNKDVNHVIPFISPHASW